MVSKIALVGIRLVWNTNTNIWSKPRRIGCSRQTSNIHARVNGKKKVEKEREWHRNLSIHVILDFFRPNAYIVQTFLYKDFVLKIKVLFSSMPPLSHFCRNGTCFTTAIVIPQLAHWCGLLQLTFNCWVAAAAWRAFLSPYRTYVQIQIIA